MDKVIVYLSLSREELLAQLAEECSEAAQAAAQTPAGRQRGEPDAGVRGGRIS